MTRKYGNYGEAHAALAAVEWAAGRGERAEEQLVRALEQGGTSWGDIECVKSSTRWPPRMYDAMQDLLQLSPQGGQGAAGAGLAMAARSSAGS